MTPIKPPENAGLFLLRGIQLYEEMLREIGLCQRKGLDKPGEIQCCFEMATNYTIKLMTEATGIDFAVQDDEIFFFKRLKPLFHAEIEFYSFCYHAELFKRTAEDNDPLELEIFYRRELLRLHKFRRENLVFYAYAEQDGSDYDQQWFTRRNDPTTEEREKTVSSSHEKLMATWIALKRYSVFIESAITDLQQQQL